ncbi:hypothetical protein BH23CHL8_BH23CHL8_17640 [soil metagenome]
MVFEIALSAATKTASVLASNLGPYMAVTPW